MSQYWMKRDKLWRFAESHIFFFFFISKLKKIWNEKNMPKRKYYSSYSILFSNLKKKKKNRYKLPKQGKYLLLFDF